VGFCPVGFCPTFIMTFCKGSHVALMEFVLMYSLEVFI